MSSHLINRKCNESLSGQFDLIFCFSLMLIIPSYVSSREGWAVTVITDYLVVYIFAYNITRVASRDNP